MKKLISLILTVLLLLSLLSCGTTPAVEPNTPAAPETPSPETAEQTAPTQTEHAFGYLATGLWGASYIGLPEVEPNITVIRSMDELEPLVAAVETCFSELAERVFSDQRKIYLQGHSFELMLHSEFLYAVRDLDDRFFEQKQLVVVSRTDMFDFQYIRPVRVYSEEGILTFALQKVCREYPGNEGLRDYAVVIALDKDVKVEAGKIKIVGSPVAINENRNLWVDYER